MHWPVHKANPKIVTLKLKPTYLLLAVLLFISLPSFSQRDILRQGGSRIKQLGSSLGGSSTDSLKRRDKNEDSITIRYRYLDSTRNYMMDSTINDFSTRFPVPATNITLGNTGTASRSLLFTPTLQAGFDPGFHAFDIYRWSVDRVRFFNTTRPYSELNYTLSSRAEQEIELVHTQNIKPNWNFLFQYRLINSTGFFRNQKANHNNYLFTSWYQSVNKRYNAYFVVLANKLQSGENGGIQDTFDLAKPIYKDRFNIYTKLGGTSVNASPDFFNTDVGTGNRYNDFTILLRQQYDLGKKDSLVTDSTVIPLFYPRLRFEFTTQFTKRSYEFRDYVGDSTYYDTTYGIVFPQRTDSFRVRDSWKEFINDFSIYQYPDAKNLQQFFKVGAAIQNMSLSNDSGTASLYNIFGHAEYRNRSRNQKWIIDANGQLYFVGFNSGDYHAYGSLQRFIGKRRAYAQLGFENVNRSPSFIFDQRSSFYLMKQAQEFNKENTIHLFGSMYQPFLQLRLGVDYYAITNYTYLRNFYELSQESSLFNVLQVSLQKTINLGRHWKWHADVYYQQRIGNAEVNLPGLFTRNRIGYEGNLGFKNLDIAFGAEVRYHTPYKGDNYSPIIGKFFYQDSVTIRNERPQVIGYVHFRIKTFKLYFRAENLNTAQLTSDGFGFTKNNIEVPGYPYPGLLLRFGIYWSFIN